MTYLGYEYALWPLIFPLGCRMQRSRGQFISSKSKPEDGSAGTASWDGTQNWGSADKQPPAAIA